MKTKLLSICFILMISLCGCAKETENQAKVETNPNLSTSFIVKQGTEKLTNLSQKAAVKGKENNNAESMGDSSKIGYGSYDVSGEFTDLMKSNPIDRDYHKEYKKFESENFNTTGWIQLEAKYADIWDKELNNIYKKLLKKLSAPQKKLLIESQKGWLQNHVKENEFVYKTFIEDESHNIGTQGLVNAQIASKNRLRDRTIQLFEYYEMLGGKVEFLHK
ncbi:lysozyme inhibitor LprI family protein [Paenibacillus puldeungensis]|uniref:Lysozyme inhibitor LprI family protein n=1 Tax=Paenibacillus puldeungensis TaxID=696536 RepID=A0ABW3S124_9BACL